MTKKETKAYGSMIEATSKNLIMEAYKAALDESTKIYHDLLRQMYEDIGNELKRHEQTHP